MFSQTIKFGQNRTRSDKLQYTARVECSCGWAVNGSNTFSKDHLQKWAEEMKRWHVEDSPEANIWHAEN